MSEWRLAGRLETEGGEAASFIGYRVEALYGVRQRVATNTEPEFSFAETSVAETQPATLAVAASTWSLCNASGDFELMLPPSDEIASEALVFKVNSLSGEFVRDRKVGKSVVPETVVIKVPSPPSITVDTAAPARTSYRIQGRVIERNGAALPPALRVMLSGVPEGAKDDAPLQPVLVATADKSGYFYGVAPNVSFGRVVASVAGVPGDTGVQLIENRIPPRLPILIDLATSGFKPKPGDCECGPTSTPRAPSQELIAELPEMFSSDFGTSGCIRFNVPNRAIEEFSFYSVVRTSEPAILGKTVGQPVADTPVTVPAQPPIPNTGGQPSTRATVALAALIERAIRTAIGLVTLSHKLPVAGSKFPVTWASLEALIRNAVIQSEGEALADDFFDQFEGWGVGKEAWTFEETSIAVVNNQPRLDAVIKAAAAAGAGLEEPASEKRLAAIAYAISPAKGGYEVELASAARAKYLDIYKIRGLARPPGRVPLDGNSPVDWDSTPTFYEASSIAHGHVLHFKQVWYADGYSLGDLLYSLPLAPGQKKLVSVIDWERREQSTRDESTVATEGVGASLTRDRDLGEVVTGTLNEMSRGGSRNTTSGVGVGTGAAGNGSYQQFNFGALIGVSGGVGESVSSANQVSAKSLSASSLQTLRDRTLQSASAVRELRSTIVQTTRQGEAVRASTEVVANHNHCHALTIQYFEVLRHFAVVNELADVQECLFVPFPMTEFNRPKVLRWRQALSAYLQRPELAPAFDATRRVETQWSEDWSPAARYADELVSAIFGELTLTIQIPLPPLPEKPKPKPEDTAADTAAAVSKALAPTEGALGVILAIGTGGASLVAGAVTAAATDAAKAAAQGARAMAESLLNTESAEERYARFQQEVMPAAAAGFVDRLELYALVGDNEVKLNGADFTLVSDYRSGLPLLVSVRGRIRNAVSRATIDALIVKSSVPLPPGCRAIVNSVRLNYQTQRFRHELLSDERVNDDIDLPVVAFTGANPLALNPGTGLPIIIPQPPLPPGFPSNWPPIPGMTPINGGAGAILYTPLDDWEQRYPRQEDYRLSKELIEHLNSNLEFYHHAIWWSMDPNRRYMLLDGHQAPNAGGKSVASVVENVVMGIVGNSLIMPVARGHHLDPQFKYLKGSTLLKHYAPQSPVPPSRVSLPTRGVFAEAVMGECNACEEIDDTKFWRWEESPIDEPPTLDMQALASRRSEPGVGSPTQFPTPIVAIQNVPQAPDAAGVKSALDVLAQQSPFRDITGLAGTQANAAAAYSKAMDTALQFGKEASELAKQAAMTKNIGQTMRAIDKAEGEEKIDKDKAKQLRTSALKQMAGADGASSMEDVKQAVQAIDEFKAAGSINANDAQALSRKALQALVAPEGRDDQAAGSDLLSEIAPENVARLSVGGDGATQVETVLASAPGRTAPAEKRGLSGLGGDSGQGSDLTEQLWDGAKAMFEAVADGVADWKDDSSKELKDAVVESLKEAAKSAALDAADKVPFVKAIKISVELSLAFVDGVGKKLDEINAQLQSKYSAADYVGAGSDGLTREDVAAIQYVRRWQQNSVEQLGSILEAGLEAAAELGVKKVLTWLSDSAVAAVGSVAKQLVGEYLRTSAGGALLAEALEEARKRVPKERRVYYRELLTTIMGVYVKQLDNPTLRSALQAPVTQLGGSKPIEKAVLAALAALLVDPVVKQAKAGLRSLIASRAKQLLQVIRAAGGTVTSGAVGATDTGVTMPASVLREIEAGADAAADIVREEVAGYEEVMRRLKEGAWAVARSAALIRQKSLLTAWSEGDLGAWGEVYNPYIDIAKEIGRGLRRGSRNAMASLAGDALTQALQAESHWLIIPFIRPYPADPRQIVRGEYVLDEARLIEKIQDTSTTL